MTNIDRVVEYIAKRYENNHEVRECLTVLYTQYAAWGLKDNKFDQDFTDGQNNHFYPYVAEMLLAQHLKNLGFDIKSADECPDFRINYSGHNIWIEEICPSPAGLPDHWFNPQSINETPIVYDVPYNQMLLRWTAALKEKKEKLTGRIGRDGNPKQGYLEKEIVGGSEPYVVAINSSQLKFGDTALHYGISQKPFALEAAFPFGAIEIVIDRETLKQVDQRHTYRASIKNFNDADIPTDNFLNPEYAGVSAILGTPAGINAVCGVEAPIALVHNPLAINKLPIGILGADEEYVAEVSGNDIELRQVV